MQIIHTFLYLFFNVEFGLKISILDEKVSGKTANSNPDLMITRSQFCKDMIPCRPFTFWDWFYAFMKLARDDLRGPWVDGHIIGFIRKSHAEEMLLNCRPGTFLLRFSDSAPGVFVFCYD